MDGADIMVKALGIYLHTLQNADHLQTRSRRRESLDFHRVAMACVGSAKHVNQLAG
jgi:hypothetical protein